MSMSEQDLITLLNSLPLPITITQQLDNMGAASYTWRWYKYNGTEQQFAAAVTKALTTTMNTVIQLAPPGK